MPADPIAARRVRAPRHRGDAARARRDAIRARPTVDALVDPTWVRRSTEPPVIRHVDIETRNLLSLANRAIRQARRQTPDGAGNQWPDLRKSDGIGYARLKFGRGLGGAYDSASLAQNAAYSGGANCGEYAALTFANLASRGCSKPIIRGHLNDLDHAFTMIGDPRVESNPVVVDAWVTKPQAHLWEKDSCWNVPAHGGYAVDDQFNNTKGDPKFDLRGITPKAISMTEARKMLGIPEGKTIMDVIEESNKDKNWVWTQEYATRQDAPYRYRWAV